MSAQNAIEAHRLAAQRGYARLFDGVGFSLQPGEALVVSGRNGSGKTTLLRIVAGLSTPAEGEIRWRGERVAAFDPRLHDAVAFNGHASALKDELTAEENLDAWLALDGPRASRESLAKALDSVALLNQRRLPVRVLSQGQRRRVGLARLALVRRALWVLDEPLTALDADGAVMLGALLDAHLAQGGLCVAASHQPLPIAPQRVRRLELGAPT
jgi:heme exporter protein A